MKAFLDHFAAILGSLTVGLLMLSVSHEWGYFYNVGSHFQTFLTTTDYLANAILWLPWAAIFMYAWVNWGVLKEGKPPTEKRDWRRLRSWVWPGIVVFFFVSILMLATWPPSYFTIAYFAGVFVAAWSFVWPMHAQKIQGVDDDLAKIWRNVIRLGPPVVAVVVGYGFVSAEQDLARKRDPYLLHFKSGATEPRVLLRNFDRGVLVRNPVENRVEFHKWDDVVRIDKQLRISRGLSYVGLLRSGALPSVRRFRNGYPNSDAARLRSSSWGSHPKSRACRCRRRNGAGSRTWL